MIDFGKIPCPSFGPQGERKAGLAMPTPFRGKALRRRHVMVQEASELLPHLPQEPGAATHCLLTGRADLMVVLVEMLGRYGNACQHLRIATLSFNDRNTVEMAMLLQSGKVASLTLLCSSFFKAHNDAEYAEARRQAAGFPDRWRIAASRNHAKVVCMDFGNRRIVTEGSANLRANGNREQLAVIMDDSVHDWHARWIDELVNRHDEEDKSE